MRWVVEQTDIVPRSRRKKAQQEGMFNNTLVMVSIVGNAEYRGRVQETMYVNASALCEYDAKVECISIARETMSSVDALMQFCNKQEQQLKGGR